jgi:cobaltochelatase CobT
MSSKNSQTNAAKENLIATLRALTASEFLQVEFDEARENNFFVWDQSLVGEGGVVLPEVEILKQVQDDEIGEIKDRNDGLEFSHPELVSGSISQFRAASDLAACYILFHDKKINDEVMLSLPSQDYWARSSSITLRQAQCDIDQFEKIRVVVEVRNIYRGVVKNILGKMEEDVDSVLSRMLDGVCNPVQTFVSKSNQEMNVRTELQTPSGASFGASYAISLLLLPEFFFAELGKKTHAKISALKKNLSEKILSEIKKLAKITADQKAFTLAVARILEMLQKEQEAREKENESEKSEQKKSDLNNFGAEKVEAESEENFLEEEVESTEMRDGVCNPLPTFSSKDMNGRTGLQTPYGGEFGASADADQIQFKNPYKIFTSKFDEIIFPQKLIAKNELEILRDQLDLRLAKLSSISKKMSLKLKRKLLSKRNSFLEFDSSRGILDRKKLSRLVIYPMVEGIYVSNKNHEYQDTALTILLDNSGSMRGSPIVMSALACEIIAEILEKFSIKTEIIGFTTADWKGGKARKLWESSGRQKNPGRLNELRHIIYKHFNQSFKKAKINLGLMLKEGVLKENIDGEALLFARSRLMQQSEKRKILLVISDGTPVDDSTTSANDSNILSDHLNHVINKIEKSSKIEIVGIGIGHTTEEFYRNSITIKSLEELGDVMIKKISELL